MEWKTKVISKGKDFDSLFEGFKVLRAIAYVASPQTILNFFDSYDYDRIELLQSEKFPEEYWNILRKDATIVERMAELIENGRLKISVPKKTIHSKFYILGQPSLNKARVVNGSANLTITAQKATRQINYVDICEMDLPTDNEWYQHYHEDYDEQYKLSKAETFMEDLIKMFQEEKETTKPQLINVWLNKNIENADSRVDTNLREIIQSISLQSFEAPLNGEPNYILQLPENPDARKKANKFLSPLIPSISKGSVDAGSFLALNKVTKYPLMHVDLEKEKVFLGFDGKNNVRTEPLPDKQTVNDALGNIEAYINTVDFGKTRDPIRVKMSIFEALLYLLSAPFASRYMDVKRKRVGLVDKRGPIIYFFTAIRKMVKPSL